MRTQVSNWLTGPALRFEQEKPHERCQKVHSDFSSQRHLCVRSSQRRTSTSTFVRCRCYHAAKRRFWLIMNYWWLIFYSRLIIVTSLCVRFGAIVSARCDSQLGNNIVICTDTYQDTN